MVKIKGKDIDFKQNMNFYLALAKNYKRYYILTAIALVIVGLIELVESLIFKELIDQGTNFAAGVITQEVFIQIIITLLIIFVISWLIKTVANAARLHYVNLLGAKIILDLKKWFFKHIIDLSHGFHTTHRTGSLIARFVRGANAIEEITDFFLFDSLPFIIKFFIAFIPIVFVDLISGIMLVLIVLAYMIFSLAVLQVRSKYNVALNEAEDTEKAHISDSFSNIETVKYFGKEDYITHKYFLRGVDTQTRQIRLWQFAKWMVSGHTLIRSIGLTMLMVSPVIRLVNGEMTIGTLAFIYTLFLNVMGPLENFTWSLRRFYTGIVDFDTLTKYYSIQKEVKDKKNAKNLIVTNGRIDFDNVSFKYNKRKILRDINLHIRPNEKIAIVGHSGSGKTTFVKLLYRLYDLNEGVIKIDGHDLTDLKQESLRSELSIVPQEGILFNDTIANNIKFSKPNATNKEIDKALKAAQFYKFVKSLPEKEKTMVGERGIKLSGGEKQRLSIARALLANKKILILDEATSALDSKTEAGIQKALQKLMKGRTTIIIAHRLSTIMHSDRIIVMDKGRIVQEGKHEQLIKKKGQYQELWALQKGGYLQE